MYFLAATLALLATSTLALPQDGKTDWLPGLTIAAAAKCVCLPGGIKDKPISGPTYPPCWYKQPDGHYDCYEKINGNCPWPDSKGPCPDDAAPPKCVCLPGGMKDKPISGPSYPPCWYKQADGHWDCYDKINGNCPWAGAKDPQCPSKSVLGESILSIILHIEAGDGVKPEM